MFESVQESLQGWWSRRSPLQKKLIIRGAATVTTAVICSLIRSTGGRRMSSACAASPASIPEWGESGTSSFYFDLSEVFHNDWE